jgi:hypothetical protein
MGVFAVGEWSALSTADLEDLRTVQGQQKEHDLAHTLEGSSGCCVEERL